MGAIGCLCFIVPVIGAFVLGMVGAEKGNGPISAILGALMGVGLVVLGLIVASMSGPPSRDKLSLILSAYQSVKGPLGKLITVADLHQRPPDWQEPDIYEYGVERLLIVQRDLLVDLLVNNNFHVENRTLVLAGDGYPEYLVQIASKCLTDNPALPVFFLHGSTPEGMRWREEIQRDPAVLAWSDHPKIDFGVSPNDVKSMKILRPLKPSRQRYELPVDAIPYPTLASALGASLEQQVPFSVILAQYISHDSGGADGTRFG